MARLDSTRTWARKRYSVNYCDQTGIKQILSMKKNRIEAFSDGVLAIIITIMVLEIKVPHGASLEDLSPLLPVFLSYVMSFVFILIYWNNHHHLFQTVKQVNGKILLANGHLLFWLSLLPFVTGWMGENNFARLPVMLFGIIADMSGIAYYILSRTLIATHGLDSTLAKAVGEDKKGITSLVLYSLGVAAAFIHPYLSLVFYGIVSVMWLIPDKRIENIISRE